MTVNERFMIISCYIWTNFFKIIIISKVKTKYTNNMAIICIRYMNDEY